MIKNIIFDLGNVILRQKIAFGGDYFAEMIPAPVGDVHAFYRRNKEPMVSGAKSFREILESARREFRIDKPAEELFEKLKASYIKDVEGVDREIIELIDSLNKNYSVYIMTNTIEPHFEYWATFGLSKYFKRIFRSDTDHFIKPEKEAYKYVLKEIKATGEECIFIDDLEINVQGAEAVGIKGIVYKNVDQLKKDLKEIGISI